MKMNEGCVVLNHWNATCEKIEFDLYNASYDEKSVWTKKCNLTWPCVKSQQNANQLRNCQQNYSSPCPTDWIYVQSSGLCKLPVDFFSCNFYLYFTYIKFICNSDVHKPKCLSLIIEGQPKDEQNKTSYIVFDFWSVSRKQEFAEALVNNFFLTDNTFFFNHPRCSVVWPCMEDTKIQKITLETPRNGRITVLSIKILHSFLLEILYRMSEWFPSYILTSQSSNH
jgi:hypothetical protein